MGIQNLSFLIVVVGMCFLLGGIINLCKIIKILGKEKRWCYLLGLVVFFLIGYFVFAVGLVFHVLTNVILLVASVYFFGSIFVYAVMKINYSTVTDIMEIKELRFLAITDPLTKLFNRRCILERLKKEICRAKRYQNSFSLLLLDVDHFKKVNDTYGHSFGDAVLVRIAEIVNIACRCNVDTPARYGGEEFMVLLPETNIEGASIIAERIRKNVDNINFKNLETDIKFDKSKSEYAQQKDINVTISIGVADNELCKGMESCEIVEWADRALYQAKAEGRNKVVSYSVLSELN